MNPARSLAPAYIWGCYKDLWIYIVAPVVGALTGAWTYNMLRSTSKSFGEIIRPNCNKEASLEEFCVLQMVLRWARWDREFGGSVSINR